MQGAGREWEKFLIKITVKNLPDTRWEGKCDAVKALRYQTAEVVAALEELEQLAVKCKDAVVNCDRMSESGQRNRKLAFSCRPDNLV